MPATATGRGAQVVLDPSGDHAKAARGAYAATLELNLQKRRDDVVAGTSADGYSPDGRTNSGGKATDEVTTPAGVGQARLLNPPVAPVGNGADTTEDTLQTYSIPANTLRSVGDRIRILAGGTMTGVTDARSARLRLNAATIYAAITSSVATTVAWRLEADVTKTGSNTQARVGMGFGTAAAVTISSGTDTMNDAAPIVVTVTGQDATTASAGAVVCNFLSVEYLPGAV